MPKMNGVKESELIGLLERNGFYHVKNDNGSHQKMTNGKETVVVVHGHGTVSPDTLHKILKQVGIRYVPGRISQRQFFKTARIQE